MVDSQETDLNTLLDELEDGARDSRGTRDDVDWTCQRRHPRNVFRANCSVSFFPQNSFSVASLPGRTRNMSRGGVGLLIRRMFHSGEPLELQILLGDVPKVYLAGRVTFCRYAGHGYYEVGVSLQAVSQVPVFSEDPVAAIERHPWIPRPQRAVF